MESATAALQASQSRAAGAKRSIYNPALELEMERTDVSFFSAELSQTFDWRNKQEANQIEASQWVKRGEMEIAYRREQLAAKLFSVITDIVNARHIADLAGERVNLMQRFVTLAESRFSAGDISQSELVTARLALSDAKVSLVEKKVLLSEAEGNFFTITGRTIDSQLIFPALILNKIADDVDVQRLAEAHPEF